MTLERIMKSDDVRQNWRDVMDDALLGSRVIIERYTKPLAVLMNYNQYKEMQERLNFLELWAEAHRINEEIEAGKAQEITLEQHKARMQTKGARYDLGNQVQSRGR